MTSIRQTFILSLYLAVCLGATMLALAETGVPLTSLLTLTRIEAILGLFPVLLTLPLAAVAYRVVERGHWSISPWGASALGIVALVVALLELWFRNIEGRLLFAAHLLVYLSWILLWQKKVSRVNWGLVALAVLQVAVGSVLTTAGWFGALLVVFMALAVWTVVLLQISAAELRLASSNHETPVKSSSGGKSLLGPGRAYPLGHALVAHWPRRPVVSSVALTVIGSLSIGMLFFLFVPRVDFGLTAFSEANEALGRRRVTGFSGRIRLGSFGQMLESNAPAFDVRITNPQGIQIDAKDFAQRLGMDEPLFRGNSLAIYRDGEWSSPQWLRGNNIPNDNRLPAYRQEYRLAAQSSPVLFAMQPVIAGHVVGKNTAVRRWSERGVLRGQNTESEKGNLQYVLFTPSDPERIARLAGEHSWFAEHGGYTDVPDDLDRLRDVAHSIAGQADTPQEKADRLLFYLRDSGEFEYSLSGGLVDPGLDPVEDFLLNRKSGHCEFFASALALMLRAEDVPARIVNGYKGGKTNGLTGRFEVQQRHAHAWVEAYIDGHWVTLDPSPAAGRESVVKASAPKVPLWSDLVNSSTRLWRDYIVGLDAESQRRAFKPIEEIATVTWLAARDDWWPAIKHHSYDFATNPKRWFSWQGGLVTFIVLLFCVGIWWIGRRAARRFRRADSRASRAKNRGRHVEFYEEFRRICAERGWQAVPTQTPREFANDVAGELGEMEIPPDLISLPAELTHDYYDIRFGDLEIEETRRGLLETRLSALRASVNRPKNGQ